MVNEKDKGTQEEKLAIITGTKKTIFGHVWNMIKITECM